MRKLVVLIIFLGIASLFCQKKDQQGTESAQAFKFKVKVVRAERGIFQKFVNYKGTVIAWQTANIMPEVSGRIKKIYKKAGDEVQAGELLAELDLTALKLQQRQAAAALQVAEKNFQDAKLNYERMEKLFAQNAVSSYQMEKTQLAYAAAQTQLESARATLEMINFNIEKSYMRAPFNGIVSSKNLEEGDMVNPLMGMGQPVMVIMNLAKVKVIIDLASEDVEKVQLGQKCRVKVAGLEEDFSGIVFSKNLAADLNSKTFRVEIAVDNLKKRIRANVFADVWIEAEKEENVLVLPLHALLQEKYVMIVENGRAKRTEIKKGAHNENEFVVLSGISEGELVITEGNYDLQEGQEVIY